MRARTVQELDRLDMAARGEGDDLGETRRGVELVAVGDGAGDGEPLDFGSAVATVAPEGQRAVDVVQEIGAVEWHGLLVEVQERRGNPRRAPLPGRCRSSDGVVGRQRREDVVNDRFGQMEVR